MLVMTSYSLTSILQDAILFINQMYDLILNAVDLILVKRTNCIYKEITKSQVES